MNETFDAPEDYAPAEPVRPVVDDDEKAAARERQMEIARKLAALARGEMQGGFG